jgi:pimeloyl-ACP methyl ester carboxylesterase
MTEPTTPTVVLVHGAWHGPWCWAGVVQRLEDAGKASALVDLPSSGPDPAALGGLHDDIAEVRRVLDGIDGPKVLVGHSYGGLPVAAAAAGRDDVVAVVYVCAFVLDEGATLLGAAGGEPPVFWDVSADGASMRASDPVAVFYGDCPSDVAERAAAHLGHQSWSSVTTPMPATAHRAVPTTYVVADADAGIPAFVQEAMAEGRVDHVVHVDSAHSPFLSRPDELTRHLLDVVDGVATS